MKLVKPGGKKEPAKRKIHLGRLGLTCPPHLEGEAAKEWSRICRELAERGMISPKLDRAVLALYCQAWARWVECEEKADETGGALIYSSEGNPIYNPWWAAAQRARDSVLKTLGELGLSPLARKQLHIEKWGKREPAPDPAEAARREKTASMRRR